MSDCEARAVTLQWEDPDDAAEFCRIRLEYRRQGWLPDASRHALLELIGESDVAECIRELYEAAKDSLRAGEHDGPCSNEDMPDEACDIHVAAATRRRERLRLALAAIDRDGGLTDAR